MSDGEKVRPFDRVKESATQKVGEARERLQDAVEDLGGRVRQGAHRASEEFRRSAGERVGQAKEVAQARVDQLRDGYSHVRDDLDGVLERAGDYVREHPAKAVLMAAGLGFLLGLILSRHEEA